jgi:hypothetical protein
MPFDLTTTLLVTAGGLILLFVIRLISKALSKKEQAGPSTHEFKECYSCGWKGKVSKFHKKCPSCGDTLT